MLVASLGITPERAKQVQFSKPYSGIDIVLMAPSGTQDQGRGGPEGPARRRGPRQHAGHRDHGGRAAGHRDPALRRRRHRHAGAAVRPGRRDRRQHGGRPQIQAMNPSANYEAKFVLRQQANGIALRRGQTDCISGSTPSSTSSRPTASSTRSTRSGCSTAAGCTANSPVVRSSRHRASADDSSSAWRVSTSGTALPGAARTSTWRCAGRADRHLRAVGLGQVDADPLHQPARASRRRAASSSTASSSRAHQRERRRGAARGRHGVPAVQPVPAPDGAAELHAGADEGARHGARQTAEATGA